jgi:hypothetical protein
VPRPAHNDRSCPGSSGMCVPIASYMPSLSPIACNWLARDAMPSGNLAGSATRFPLLSRLVVIHPSSKFTVSYPAATRPVLISSWACASTSASLAAVRYWYQVL